MAEEAGHELSLFAAPRSPGRNGAANSAATTSVPPAPTVGGAPGKARNIATSQTRPDDEHLVRRSSTSNSYPQSEMSRAPLLVRSSPAQGTGKLAVELHFLRPSHTLALLLDGCTSCRTTLTLPGFILIALQVPMEGSQSSL